MYPSNFIYASRICSRSVQGASAQMPLPPAVQKLLDDADKKLHEENAVTKVLEQIEMKTGVRRLHIVSAFVAAQALYLIFGSGAELMCNVIGFLYPAYVSVKAIETANKDDDTQWLTYWVVFALLSVVEFFSNTFTQYFPVYWLFKCAFLLYLYLPMTLGAQKIYYRFIQPFVVKHQTAIDKRIGRVAENVADAIDSARREFEHHVKPN
uniref:Receptor expression-enhancing protein n=1 Tax=Parascaris univalens TaxID=6257 RepID=A0A915B310_PARUN